MNLQGGDSIAEGSSEDDQRFMHQATSKESNKPLENREVDLKETDVTDEEDEQSGGEEDPELEKRLSKQRQRAIQAARGRRKVVTSRNTYKDKGGKSSHSSKIHNQLSGW